MKKAALSIDSQAFELVADRFKILGKPMRLHILQILRVGKMTVAEITLNVGSTQPNVSKHLKALYAGGILARGQEGTTVYYWIADKQVLRVMDTVWSNLLDHLKERSKTLKGWRSD